MVKFAAMLGFFALAAALGAQLVAELVVVPGIEAQRALVDANLARALAAPVHLRLADVVLAACLVLAAVVPRWLASKLATTAALAAVGIAAANRMLVLPAAYLAWSKADLIAGRPVDRILEAERLMDQSTWLAMSLVLLLGGLAWAAAMANRTHAVTAEPSEPNRAAEPAAAGVA